MDVNAGIPDENQPTYGEGKMGARGGKPKNKGKPYGKPQFVGNLKPYQQRWSALRTEGLSKWYPIWRDLSRFILPKRGFFEGMMPNWGTRIDHKTILSSDPQNHVRTLASGMQAGLTSPAQPWFRLEVDDAEAMKQDENKSWLEMATKKVQRAFAASNIYGCFYSMYEEVSNFGTACFLILEDRKNVIRGRMFTSGEYFLGCGPDGKVNAFARQFWMTAGQMVKEFDYENCSQQIQNEYDDDVLDTWHVIYHLIEENDERIPERKDFLNMAFRSIYWEASTENNGKALSKRGFEEFPGVAVRWDTTTTADAYGNGPGWVALGDVKTLYRMVKKYLEAVDKAIDPPMVAPSGVVVNTLPGGLTRDTTAEKGGVRPAYQIQPNLPEMRLAIEALSKKIGDVFLSSFFLMISQTGKDMTAEEVIQRQGEKVLMLAPVLDRLQTEGLGPAIERTFNVLIRAKALPPPPRGLSGKAIKIKYISQLAQAQQIAETAIIEQFVRFLGGLAGAQPQVLDNANFDEMVRQYAADIGLPSKALNSLPMMAQLRAARSKQQQTAAMAQNAQAAAQTASVLGKTPLGGGTALAALLDGNGGAAQPAGVA